MCRKRLIQLAGLSLLGIAVLILRLAQIQLFETESFSKRNINLIQESVNQRTQTVILDHGRGKFYDRDGRLINYETVPTLVLFPFLKNMNWDSKKVAEIIGIPEEELLGAVKRAKEPIVYGNENPLVLTQEQMDAINSLEIPGVFAVNRQMDKREPLASQLIGLIRENPEEAMKRYPDKALPQNVLIGITGLEKSFDEFLLQEEMSKLVFHVDGKGGPLFGINVKYIDSSSPFYPVKVKTTLDLDIQEAVEKIVDIHGVKKGGLVLLDIASNSILALVSRPKVDLADPYKNEGAKNFMITSSIPGSIFKTVIAAAAIERDLITPGRFFDCSQTIHGEEDEIFEHGIYDFTTSFAASCNYTFGTLARELARIAPEEIENYAGKLGLLSTVGWQGRVFHYSNFRQLADEEEGQVFFNEEERYDSNYVAQAGLGQQSVRITPLQAANMMATIARGGQKEMVRAVSAIEYKNGSTMYRFPQEKLEGESISPYTAMKLQRLLREVVVNPNGTGRALKDLPYSVAGKSGTAQNPSDQETKENEDKANEKLNRWFVGYFPFEQPKYALAVVNLDVTGNGGSAIPIFQDMVKFLYEYDHRGQD